MPRRNELRVTMNEQEENDWRTFLFQTICMFENVETIRNFIEHNKGMLQLDYGLYYACLGKNNKIIELMICSGARTDEKMPKKYTEYKKAQILTFTKLHESLVDFVLSH